MTIFNEGDKIVLGKKIVFEFHGGRPDSVLKADTFDIYIDGKLIAATSNRAADIGDDLSQLDLLSDAVDMAKTFITVRQDMAEYKGILRSERAEIPSHPNESPAELLARFKRGETLSTLDLMSLQFFDEGKPNENHTERGQ